jgi:hypothetical protein
MLPVHVLLVLRPEEAATRLRLDMIEMAGTIPRLELIALKGLAPVHF